MKLFQAIRNLLTRKRIRKINKDLFIKIVERDLVKQHKEEGGVYIPEFLEARSVYENFKKNGCFDENGYLKSEHLKNLQIVK